VLHGVVSWLPGCGVSEYPGGVFTSVFSMMGFIQDILVSTGIPRCKLLMWGHKTKTAEAKTA
jgi:secreted trypsin-like serine protease